MVYERFTHLRYQGEKFLDGSVKPENLEIDLWVLHRFFEDLAISYRQSRFPYCKRPPRSFARITYAFRWPGDDRTDGRKEDKGIRYNCVWDCGTDEYMCVFTACGI